MGNGVIDNIKKERKDIHCDYLYCCYCSVKLETLELRGKHELECSYGPRLVVEIQTDAAVEELLRSKVQQCNGDRMMQSKKLLTARSSQGSADRKTHQCNTCPFTTRHRDSLRRHELLHTENAYFCFKCGHSTEQRGYLVKHILNRHSNSMNISCSHCKRRYKSKQAQQEHVLKCHPKFANTVTCKVHSCNLCSLKTTYKYYLDIHIMLKHKKNVDLPDLQSVHIPTYKCTICTYQTTVKGNLYYHQKFHDSERRATKRANIQHDCCLKSNSMLVNRSRLNEHILRHHSDDKELLKTITSTIKYCKFCDYKTVVLKSYKLHTENIDGSSNKRVPTYKCDTCSYKSHHKLNYKTHLGIHSDKKRFCCSSCSKKFAKKVNLDEHILRQHYENHQLIKTVTQSLKCCLLCDFKTVKPDSLISHLKIHA